MKTLVLYSSLILSAFLFGCSTSQENETAESTETTKVEGTLRIQDGRPSVIAQGAPWSPPSFDMHAKVYYVQGSVKSPGQFTLQEGISVSGAINLAGGFEREAKSLSLTRNGKLINLGSISSLSSDPPIQAGDVIKAHSSSN